MGIPLANKFDSEVLLSVPGYPQTTCLGIVTHLGKKWNWLLRVTVGSAY